MPDVIRSSIIRRPLLLSLVATLALALVVVGAIRLARAGVAQQSAVPIQRLEAAALRPTSELYKSSGPASSANGQLIAFWSAANSLVPDDTNNASDVFVWDYQSGSIERISVGQDGRQANGPSLNAAVSSDGRLVAFESRASNLVPGDTNNSFDIFVKDRQSGAIERVSQTGDGTQANGASHRPVLSPDGRLVAFWSEASNLAPNDENGSYENGGYDIFVKDRQSGALERVSVAPDGTEGNGDSTGPAASADGRFVVFGSYSNNLVAADDNSMPDVFVKDRQTGGVERMSAAGDGTEGNAESFWNPTISADGHFVAFWSEASNLVAGDTNGVADVFVKDRQTGALERLSMGADGAQGNGPSYGPVLSADGRFVAFWSEASNLVAGDTNGTADVFLKDRQSGVLERVSLAGDGTQGNGPSYSPILSPAGGAVAFWSEASNLVAGDGNGRTDVFLVERPGVQP